MHRTGPKAWTLESSGIKLTRNTSTLTLKQQIDRTRRNREKVVLSCTICSLEFQTYISAHFYACHISCFTITQNSPQFFGRGANNPRFDTSHLASIHFFGNSNGKENTDCFVVCCVTYLHLHAPWVYNLDLITVATPHFIMHNTHTAYGVVRPSKIQQVIVVKVPLPIWNEKQHKLLRPDKSQENLSGEPNGSFRWSICSEDRGRLRNSDLLEIKN